MTTPAFSASGVQSGQATSFSGHVHYKTFPLGTLAIYPGLAGVADVITLFNNEG